MAWDDLLAAVGGAASGYENQHRYNQSRELSQEKIDMAEKVAELKAMISQFQISAANERANLAEAGRNSRNDKNNTTRTDIADQSSKDRRYGVDTSAETTRRGQDLADTRYWDEAGRAWSFGDMRDATTRRGQDITASTARRGQDITEGTATKNRDAAVSGRDEQYALNAYRADLANRRQQAGSLFQNPTQTEPSFEDWLRTTADPEVFPSVRRARGIPEPARPQAPAGADRVVPPPAPMGAPPASRPAPPVPARPSAAAPPAAAPAVAPPARTPAAASPLETQARTLIDQIRAADAAGQDSTALRRQLATLRATVR